jgi:hypothetical protein
MSIGTQPAAQFLGFPFVDVEAEGERVACSAVKVLAPGRGIGGFMVAAS